MDVERGPRCARQLLLDLLLTSLRLRLRDGQRRIESNTTLERALGRRWSLATGSSVLPELCRREFSEEDVDEDGESRKKDRTESETVMGMGGSGRRRGLATSLWSCSLGLSDSSICLRVDVWRVESDMGEHVVLWTDQGEDPYKCSPSRRDSRVKRVGCLSVNKVQPYIHSRVSSGRRSQSES